jgi:hypothetical protein
MSPTSPPRSLPELRKSYQAHLAAHQGRCEDVTLLQELVAALENELKRVDVQLDRSGTVYHMPRIPKG